MNLFSEITQFAGKEVKIEIEHKIYGKQKFKVREFAPIVDNEKVGFVINNNEIYINLDDLEGWEYKDTSLHINGKLMLFTITIK